MRILIITVALFLQADRCQQIQGIGPEPLRSFVTESIIAQELLIQVEEDMRLYIDSLDGCQDNVQYYAVQVGRSVQDHVKKTSFLEYKASIDSVGHITGLFNQEEYDARKEIFRTAGVYAQAQRSGVCDLTFADSLKMIMYAQNDSLRRYSLEQLRLLEEELGK